MATKLNKTAQKLLAEIRTGQRRAYNSSEGRRIRAALAQLRDAGLIESYDHHREAFYVGRPGRGRNEWESYFSIRPVDAANA